MDSRKNVLNIYKNLLKMCNQMKDPQKSDIFSKIQNEFRSNKSEMSSERLKDYIFIKLFTIFAFNCFTHKQNI